MRQTVAGPWIPAAVLPVRCSFPCVRTWTLV